MTANGFLLSGSARWGCAEPLDPHLAMSPNGRNAGGAGRDATARESGGDLIGSDAE